MNCARSCENIAYVQPPIVIRPKKTTAKVKHSRRQIEEVETVRQSAVALPRKAEQFVAIELPEPAKRRQVQLPQRQAEKQEVEVHIDKTEGKDCLVKLYKKIQELQGEIAMAQKKCTQLETRHSFCRKPEHRQERRRVHRVEDEVEQVQQIVDRIVQVPKYVPVQQIMEVEVVKIKQGPIQVKQRIVEVKKVVEKEKIVKVPVERVVYKPKRVEIPVEKVRVQTAERERPIDRVIYKERPIQIRKPVYKERQIKIPVEVPYDVEVEVPYQRMVPREVEVPVPIEVEVPTECRQQMPYGRGVEEIEQQPYEIWKDVVVEVPVRVQVPVAIQVPVQKEVVIERQNVVYRQVGKEWLQYFQNEQVQNASLNSRLKELEKYLRILQQADSASMPIQKPVSLQSAVAIQPPRRPTLVYQAVQPSRHPSWSIPPSPRPAPNKQQQFKFQAESFEPSVRSNVIQSEVRQFRSGSQIVSLNIPGIKMTADRGAKNNDSGDFFSHLEDLRSHRIERIDSSCKLAHAMNQLYTSGAQREFSGDSYKEGYIKPVSEVFPQLQVIREEFGHQQPELLKNPYETGHSPFKLYNRVRQPFSPEDRLITSSHHQGLPQSLAGALDFTDSGGQLATSQVISQRVRPLQFVESRLPEDNPTWRHYGMAEYPYNYIQQSTAYPLHAEPDGWERRQARRTLTQGSSNLPQGVDRNQLVEMIRRIREENK